MYSDGGARGNPGPAGIGVVIKDVDGNIIEEHGEYIGETTNNQAEYQALIKGLELALELGSEEAQCFLDSELVVRQLKQEYKVKEPGLQKLFVKAWNLSQKFKKISFQHVRRELNTEADRLVNNALDGQG